MNAMKEGVQKCTLSTGNYWNCLVVQLSYMHLVQPWQFISLKTNAFNDSRSRCETKYGKLSSQLLLLDNTRAHTAKHTFGILEKLQIKALWHSQYLLTWLAPTDYHFYTLYKKNNTVTAKQSEMSSKLKIFIPTTIPITLLFYRKGINWVSSKMAEMYQYTQHSLVWHSFYTIDLKKLNISHYIAAFQEWWPEPKWLIFFFLHNYIFNILNFIVTRALHWSK